MSINEHIEAIIDYWIGPDDITPAAFGDKTRLWYFSKPETDDTIRRYFADDLAAAERGELDEWAASTRGMLALVTLLDQFSRNLYRGTPDAFRNDEKAQQLLLPFLAADLDRAMTVPQKLLVYHPLHHAEDAGLQAQAVAAHEAILATCDAPWRPVAEETVKFSREHRDIIDRFGRFPHRNRILKRRSTPEELAFLDADPRGYGQG